MLPIRPATHSRVAQHLSGTGTNVVVPRLLKLDFKDERIVTAGPISHGWSPFCPVGLFPLLADTQRTTSLADRRASPPCRSQGMCWKAGPRGWGGGSWLAVLLRGAHVIRTIPGVYPRTPPNGGTTFAVVVFNHGAGAACRTGCVAAGMRTAITHLLTTLQIPIATSVSRMDLSRLQAWWIAARRAWLGR